MLADKIRVRLDDTDSTCCDCAIDFAYALRAVLAELSSAADTPTAKLLARCIERRIADALGVDDD
jgi:hypothetical protein